MKGENDKGNGIKKWVEMRRMEGYGKRNESKKGMQD